MQGEYTVSNLKDLLNVSTCVHTGRIVTLKCWSFLYRFGWKIAQRSRGSLIF